MTLFRHVDVVAKQFLDAWTFLPNTFWTYGYFFQTHFRLLQTYPMLFTYVSDIFATNGWHSVCPQINGESVNTAGMECWIGMTFDLKATAEVLNIIIKSQLAPALWVHTHQD